MISTYKMAVFFPSGVCNLNCRYCQIDKNPLLKTIDDTLEESFKGDYYFTRLKKYFPNRGQLESIETWGGEPFLHMDRIYPLIHQVIDYYPYFSKMFSSTNFSFPSWLNEFYGLMNVFGEYPERDFSYQLQLSCDGPEYLNDASRGIGVTQKCLENFKKLIDTLPTNLPSNINLTISLKPTLDIDSFKLLDSKEKIIEYYKFFENNFLLPLDALSKQYENITYHPPVPNIAVPTPATTEDGKLFTKLIKNCLAIEKEIESYFQIYKKITPFDDDIANSNDTDLITAYYCNGTCGTGFTSIGFLPQNMITTCNEGFTQLVANYKEYAAKADNSNKTITFDTFLAEQPVNKLCMTEEDYKKYETQMSYYNCENTCARLNNVVVEILSLALAKQIDISYLDQQKALKAAIEFTSRNAYCVKDNYNVTGSVTQIPIGMLRLLLNGALDAILEDKKNGI